MGIRSINFNIVFLGLTTLVVLCMTAQVMAKNAAGSYSRDAGPYVDMDDYLQGSQRDAWSDATYFLMKNFNDVCGDTFCEGEYSNIQELRYRCSVDANTGIVGECAWLFAASEEQINPIDGKIIAQPKIWACVSPLAPQTHAVDLVQALANQRPLFSELPQTDESLFDGLIDCL
ncbi:hypothetical protein ACFFJT_03375 [Dyella flava]|uniref:Integron gene cassette protein n=1 Tax=Dyella flava TaxID=1920170 RepID=A0ABS2K5A4_9GAMM|nr:hypothetical protein [Dyella flava]MBM7126392.1 hypothetical protein [Dyella flava]GLQ49789.1 hypothetical protein GCM10010872_12380 [Dyella flava]